MALPAILPMIMSAVASSGGGDKGGGGMGGMLDQVLKTPDKEIGKGFGALSQIPAATVNAQTGNPVGGKSEQVATPQAQPALSLPQMAGPTAAPTLPGSTKIEAVPAQSAAANTTIGNMQLSDERAKTDVTGSGYTDMRVRLGSIRGRG